MKKIYVMAVVAMSGMSLVSCSADAPEEIFQPTQKQQEVLLYNPDYEMAAKEGDSLPPPNEGGTGEDGTIPVKPPKKP